MMCMALILVCSVSISTFAVDRMSQVESGTTQSVQKTDNQNSETATTRQKSSEAETKTKQENTKKSDSESKTKETKDSSEEKQSDSKDVNDKGAKENSTQKEKKEEKEEKEKKEKSEKDTSKEEKSTKEETDTDKKTTDTTDASEATTKTVEEKKTESAEEKTTEAATEKTTESKDSEEETSEKKAEEETQAADAKRQKIQVANITEPKEVQVGKTITLKGTTAYYHSWSSSNKNIATVTSNGSTAKVTGVAVGKATITHTYGTYGWNNLSETYEVTVTKFEDNYSGNAAIYYLANPAGDPWTNDTGAWAPSKESSETIAQINTKGATWEAGYVGSQIYNNKNIKSNVASYIKSWPDSSMGGTWTVKKDDSATDRYFKFILDSIWVNYKSSVAEELSINENDLKKENITEITLTPRKISRDNGGEHEYHIDCALSIKSTQVFTAKFWVKGPGASEYTQVDSKNYMTGKSVTKTTKAEIGSTETVDGVTYVLDGWYPENEAGGAYDSTKIEDAKWGYSPSDAELVDGTVNFYAHYSPITTSITLQKLVTGNMGDKQKEFAFTCTYSSYDAITKETETKTASFNLKDGQSSTEIKNVYIGSQFTVKETNAQGYTTSGSYNNADISSVEHGIDKASSEKIAKVQITEDGKNITITNNKEAIPDTGIASDVLPFITLFALSIAGIIGFLLYSYKKRFV